MSSRVTISGDGLDNVGGDGTRSNQSTNQRRQRSRSTSRYADMEKPKKKKTLSATTSLVSIPNTIKLSMLNSGLLSFERVKLEARDENNSLSQTIPDKPIELHHFVKLCEQRRKFRVLYKLEFQCIPYDYNRVVLNKLLDGTLDSDYINASYVDSLLKPNAYIVTQGPTEETVNDFWRMVWQENVSAIIMLTKVFDFTKVMCIQYWPAALDKTEVYGDIHIEIVADEQLANFQIRTFRIWKENLDGVVSEQRHILQFHYTEWHSHTNPFSNAVLEFRRRVRAVVGNIITANSVAGPMLVHCNDGGGRSGVYLAIDANMELAEEEDCFHVFGYLKKLRQSRKGLIENVEQYKFVYDTLEEHIKCGKTWFPVAELSERLKSKARKDPVNKMNEYQKEYAQICKQTPRFTIGDCAGGHRADNREKNRDVLCVPPDNFRPYLTSFQGNAFTDYINAVFVDGYTKPREYIVTEWPLKHTVGEFWSLVYDQECSAVVVLCQPPPTSQAYPSFWPEKSKMEKYGPVFSVHLVSRRHYQNIKQWEFKINKKIVSLTELMAGVKAPTKTVQLFQLTCFPLGHKVPTSTNSLVALMNMVENWRAKTDYGPVCVVSPDGRGRAGVYCAANACIEQVIQHGEVDIFQAAKTVRRHRPQLMENMTEYKYCYDLVLHYVLHYLNKELKEKKFIEFGRGKAIPLTPDSSNADLPGEISNTGKIVVKKRIAKIEKTNSLQQYDKDSNRMNGRLVQRKKKGRLYSLGGNEPPKRAVRGRLDRLKTVGTFDLGSDMDEVMMAKLHEQSIETIDESAEPERERVRARRMSANALIACNKNEAGTSSSIGFQQQQQLMQQRTSITPGPCRREIHKSGFAKRMANQKYQQNIGSASSSPASRRFHSSSASISTSNSQLDMPIQRSADDCSEKRKMHMHEQRKKSRSSSTSVIQYETDRRYSSSTQLGAAYRKSPNNYLPATNFFPKTDYKQRVTNDSCVSKVMDDDIEQMITTQSTEAVTEEPTFDDERGYGIYRPRKPVLRKSRRIVRTDSELFDSDRLHLEMQQTTTTTRAQIHNQPSPITAIDRNVKSDEMSRSVEMQPSTSVAAACQSSSPADRMVKSAAFADGIRNKYSSDLDDTCTPGDVLKSTTTNSSRNISIDEVNSTVFSDSATDLEKMERDYRELARSMLQRGYKSDGDTLDVVGKRRNDFQNWKNQSFETNFELCCQQLCGDAMVHDNDHRNPLDPDHRQMSAVANPNATKSEKQNEMMTKLDRMLNSTEFFKRIDQDRMAATFSPSSHSSDYGGIDINSRNINVADILTTYSQPDYNSSKENVSSSHCDGYTSSAIISPIKSIETAPQMDANTNAFERDGLHETTATTTKPQQSILLHRRPSKLDITQNKPAADTTDDTDTDNTTDSKDGKLLSLFEKRLRKFKKIKKLLKSNRFSGSSDKHKTKSIEAAATSAPAPKPIANKASNAIGGGSTAVASTSGKSSGRTNAISDISSKFFRSRFSPGKSSTSDSKNSVYSSKMSLFSAIAQKSSILSKSNASSHSTNELHSMRTNSKTQLNEISKSNSAINSLKTSSPMRFSVKRSSKKAKPMSSACIYTDHQKRSHSPLSEEFYNKTGSVRLSAIELYQKFQSADFVGLYKQEPIELVDPNDHYRKSISRAKNARLLKQKSEPKFSFGGDLMDYDPREEDEDFYQEEFSEMEDEFYEYEGEEEFDEIDDEMYSEDDEDDEEKESLQDDEQRAYHSESDVDEIFLMPDTEKCLEYMQYEQYGFENKHFALEHPQMVCKMSGRDHDLSVIDEIPYLDEMPSSSSTTTTTTMTIGPTSSYVGASGGGSSATQAKYACVTTPPTTTTTTQSTGTDFDDEMLTVYTICTSDDLLTVKEVDEPVETSIVDSSPGSNQMHANTMAKLMKMWHPHQSTSTQSDSDRSMRCALTTYMKGAAPDISVDIEPLTHSDGQADAHTIIQRAGSFELLSNSSETIRSGSTLTGYDFDTVKNLNLDSCSTSKLSLSLRSDGFDEFTLTPDEPKIMRHCDVDDFTLTPDASFCEPPPLGHSGGAIGNDNTFDMTANNPRMAMMLMNDGRIDGANCSADGYGINDESSTLSNEVLVIVDKFLANERLLQHNLNIIPIKQQPQSLAKNPNIYLDNLNSSPQISPIDSDASSMNLLWEKRKGTIFNLQSSSSKSTLDDTLDLDKINFDYDDYDDYDDSNTAADTNTNQLDSYGATNQMKQSTEILAQTTKTTTTTTTADSTINSDHFVEKCKIMNTNRKELKSLTEPRDSLSIDEPAKVNNPPPVMPSSRFSMQNLQPYFFCDDIIPKIDSNTNDSQRRHSKIINNKSQTPNNDSHPANDDESDMYDIDSETNQDCCRATKDSSFLQKRILSKLKKNKSQSLGNLNKKSGCFPL